MNRLRLIVVCLASSLILSVKGRAELVLKNGLTQPFYSSKLNIEWVSTNALPRSAVVFEVVPDLRPDIMVSNLMSIGRFRQSQRVKGFDPLQPLPKSTYAFQADDDGRTLVYFPQQGRVDFNDESAFRGPASREKVQGVPDDATVLRLARPLLAKLGISTNDIVKNASGDLRCVYPTGSWGHTDSDSQVFRRGIGFTRSLDGKEVDGQRAVFMEFGNDAKLGKLEAYWCTLKSRNSFPVAQPEQIVNWIKEGRSVVLSLSGPSDARYVRATDIKKITITNVQPRYPYIDEDSPPKFVYPYVHLTATAKFGEGDTEQIFLSCPLIAEGLSKARRPTNAGFSIYPSSRSARRSH